MNKLTKYIIMLCCLCSMLVLSTAVSAENMKKMGKMNIHYMAIGATFFTPEIAKAYGIERSKYNGLVNISVLDNSKEGTPAKTVSITGTARNLADQKKTLSFKEVREGGAIYYLAEVDYRNEETIRFDLTITDGEETHRLEFSQKFYVE
ncbi:DUF4426 domain-containing protein [Thalassotalea fusca]